MTTYTRRILFYFLFFLFIAISGPLVAYSLGVKFDFKNLSLSATGGIYLKSEPSDATIFLNDKEVKNQSGFLQSGTLVDGLEKGNYYVLLKKDGYFDWEKNVQVQPSIVEVFDSIVLMTKKDPERFANPATKFYVSGKILILENEGVITVEGAKLIGSRVEDLAGETVITYNDKNKNYYLSNLSSLDSSLNVNLLFNNLKESRLGLPGSVPIIKAVVHPFNDQKLIIQSRGALYNLDTLRLNIEQIGEGVKDFSVKGEDVFFYDGEAFYRYNLIFRTKTKLLDLSGDNDKTINDFQISSAGEVMVLFDNGELRIISGENENLKIADKAKTFLLSDDGRFVAFLDYDGPFYVYRLDKKEYLKLETGINEEITKIDWYRDNKHLLAQTEDGLYFTEVDDDLPLNTIKLASGVSQFEYKADTDSLYFSTPAGIFRLEFL